MITLWRPDFEGCPATWSVRLVLAEKSLDHKQRPVSIDPPADDLLAVNPRGEVPVLQDGQVCVAGATAIALYLEYAYPEPGFMPVDQPQRAQALGWLYQVDRYLAPAAASLWKFKLTTPPAKRQPQRDSELVAAVLGECQHLEDHLRHTQLQFLGGKTPSLADYAVLPYIANCVQFGLRISARYPRLAAWIAYFSDRPAFRTTTPQAPPPPEMFFD